MTSYAPARPADAPGRPFTLPAVRTWSPVTGLEIVQCALPTRQIVNMRLVLSRGAALERADRTGAATLAARLLGEGSGRCHGDDFAQALELLGASVRAEASWDAITVFLTAPAATAPGALALLWDAVLDPAFTEGDVARVRAERADELARERADAGHRGHQAFAAALSEPGSRYDVPLGGDDRVRDLQRDDLLTFWNEVLAATATLVVVGPPVDLGTPAWRGEAAPTPVTSGLTSRRQVILVDRPGAAQTMLIAGHPIPARGTTQEAACGVLLNALAGPMNMKARLNWTIREQKGYAYGSYAMPRHDRRGGLMPCEALVETGVTGPALADLVGEIVTMQAGGLTEQEYRDGRGTLLGGLPNAWETTAQIADTLAKAAGLGLPVAYQQSYLDSLTTVGYDDAAAFAATGLRPDELTVVAVGDLSRVGEDIEALELGPIVRQQA